MQSSKTKNWVVGLLAGTAVLGTMFPTTLNAMSSTDPYANSTKVSIAARKSILVIEEATALDIWLEKLIQKESHGREKIKILDVNGKYSYGCLQFQENTFRSYGAKYGLVSPGANLESVIYDCNLQKEIAKRMISNDYKMWQSWYTSVIVRDLGLPPRS